MAILPAIQLSDGVPAREAARQLGLSPQRVRALVASGELPAQKVAGRWFIQRAALDGRIRDRRLTGRPFSTANAWGLIALADGDSPRWLNASNRSRLRRVLRDRDLDQIIPLLRHRARRLLLRAHSSDVQRLEDEPAIVRSGASASSEYRFEIKAPGVLEAYVPVERLQGLEQRYHLKASREPNVILHVIDGPWPLAAGQRFAPRLAAVLDLLDDDDERSRRAGQTALAKYRFPQT